VEELRKKWVEDPHLQHQFDNKEDSPQTSEKQQGTGSINVRKLNKIKAGQVPLDKSEEEQMKVAAAQPPTEEEYQLKLDEVKRTKTPRRRKKDTVKKNTPLSHSQTPYSHSLSSHPKSVEHISFSSPLNEKQERGEQDANGRKEKSDATLQKSKAALFREQIFRDLNREGSSSHEVPKDVLDETSSKTINFS
jgi:hypothetical protein